MANDNKPAVDVDFDKLTPQQQEAYIPRGEYKNPEMLDQGNAPKGAPGVMKADDDSAGDPEPVADDKPKTSRKRTA